MLMADFVFQSSSSPGKQNKTPTSFLFGFTAFASKAISETELAMSPTSILDSKPFSALKNPFWTDTNLPKSSPRDETKSRNGIPKFDNEGVGLGIIDSLTSDAENTKQNLIVPKKTENSRFVLFGSQLKIQIPNPNTNFVPDSPNSPMEFGIKTKNSHLNLVSPSNCVVKSSNLGIDTPGSISAAEMELSEDYTCVISRGGPVTKTTRIFDNCIVDSCLTCFGDAGGSPSYTRKNENMVSVSPDVPIRYPSDSFLSFCHTCKMNLDHGKDIYIYRGEKAFCSDECRREGMKIEKKQEREYRASGMEDYESW